MTFSTTEAQQPLLHASLPKISGATAKSKHTTCLNLWAVLPSLPKHGLPLNAMTKRQIWTIIWRVEVLFQVAGWDYRVQALCQHFLLCLLLIVLAHRKPPTKEMAQHLDLPPAHRAGEKAHFKEVKRLLFRPKKMKQEKALISGQLFEPLALLHFAISRSWV